MHGPVTCSLLCMFRIEFINLISYVRHESTRSGHNSCQLKHKESPGKKAQKLYEEELFGTSMTMATDLCCGLSKSL